MLDKFLFCAKIYMVVRLYYNLQQKLGEEVSMKLIIKGQAPKVAHDCWCKNQKVHTKP